MTSRSSRWLAAADGIARASRCASIGAVVCFAACFGACIGPSEWTKVGNTIVVDEANGPGAQFTDIPDAVAAAAPGDLVLVRPGEYSPFLLNKAITILGAPNGASRVTRASTLPVSVVGGVPQGEVAVIADLDFPSTLSVWGTRGTVALDACTVGRLIVPLADDVRVYRAAHIDRVQMQRSHVEIVSCQVGGGVTAEKHYAPTADHGRIHQDFSSENHWPTAFVDDHGKLIGALTSIRGRHLYFGINGPDINGLWITYGTSACHVDGESSLVLIGTSADVVRGGDSVAQPGVSYGDFLFVTDGWAGDGIRLERGQVSRSGVQLLGGTGVDITGSLVSIFTGLTRSDGNAISGADAHRLVEIVPDNPTLELLDTPTPGSKVRLRVRGPAGSQVSVEHGPPTIVAVPATRPIETLVKAAGSSQSGVMPGTGEHTSELEIDPAVGKGWHVFLQARLVLPSGAVRVSNSVLLVAR